MFPSDIIRDAVGVTQSSSLSFTIVLFVREGFPGRFKLHANKIKKKAILMHLAAALTISYFSTACFANEMLPICKECSDVNPLLDKNIVLVKKNTTVFQFRAYKTLLHYLFQKNDF